MYQGHLGRNLILLKCNFTYAYLLSGSKPKSKPKREETKEEKSFKRRARYFLTAQLVSVVLFVTLLSRVDEADVEVDDDGYE